MSTNTLSYVQAFTVIVCSYEGCGVSFALNDEYISARRDDHQTWYCPNGHPRYYPGENKLEREQRLRQRAERAAANAQESARSHRAEAELQRRKAAAARGQVTKVKRRVGKGVCPCCNRSFVDLARHMAGKHPDYADSEA